VEAEMERLVLILQFLAYGQLHSQQFSSFDLSLPFTSGGPSNQPGKQMAFSEKKADLHMIPLRSYS
jgi:hypothetical protein